MKLRPQSLEKPSLGGVVINSFKKFGIVLMTVAMLILMGAIAMNMMYMKPLFHKSYDFREDILAYEVVLGESKLPLGVIENVAEQFKLAPDMPKDRAQRLTEAYMRNVDLLSTNQQAISLYVEMLNRDFAGLSEVPLLPANKRVERIRGNIELLIEDCNQLEHFIQELSGSDVYGAFEAYPIIQRHQEEMSVATKVLLQDMSVWNKEIVNQYLFISNSIYLLLLLVSLILAVFLIRVIGIDIHYMMTGFAQLSRFDTKLEKLPLLKPFFKEEEVLKCKVEEIFKEQNFLNELKEISNKYYVLDDILDQLFHMVQSIFPVDRLGIAFIHEDTQSIAAEYGICSYEQVHLKAGYEVKLRNTSLGMLAKTGESMITESIRKALEQKPTSHTLKILAEEGIASNMVIPLINDNLVFGFLFFSSRVENSYNTTTLQMGKNISHELASIINKTYLTKKMFSMVARTFARLVEQKDNETGNHINRMTDYSVILATALVEHPHPEYRVKQSFIKDMENDASIHDIGKVAIPDEILKKPGKLTSEEFEVMKSHAKIGSQILMEMQENLKHFNTNFYQVAIDITSYHHEKWDGSGYPYGLRGTAIPLAARIVAIADVFDALTSRRPYKEPYGFDEAVAIIKEGRGKHFDPILVDLFLALLPKFESVYIQSESRF